MPLNEDFLREERIKRLRAVVKLGSRHLVTLHDLVPTYLRRAEGTQPKKHMPIETRGEDRVYLVLPDSTKRELAIAAGVVVDNRTTNPFKPIFAWLDKAKEVAQRDLSEELYAEFVALGEYTDLSFGPDIETTLEEQLGAVTIDIERRLELFDRQLNLDGKHEDMALSVRDAGGGWPHLRGKLTDAVLDGYLTRMRRRRTKAEISDSIGAAKELLEASLKAKAAELLVTAPAATPDLSDWWKAVRPGLVDANVEKALGSKDGAVLKLLSSQVATIQNLGELRNKVGSGHGKTAHPAGLTSTHALLAVDTAHTVTRFLFP